MSIRQVMLARAMFSVTVYVSLALVINPHGVWRHALLTLPAGMSSWWINTGRMS